MQPAWASAIGTTNPHMAARPLTKGFKIACLKQITKAPIPKHKKKIKKPKSLTISQCEETNLQNKNKEAFFWSHRIQDPRRFSYSTKRILPCSLPPSQCCHQCALSSSSVAKGLRFSCKAFAMAMPVLSVTTAVMRRPVLPTTSFKRSVVIGARGKSVGCSKSSTWPSGAQGSVKLSPKQTKRLHDVLHLTRLQ